MPVLFTNNAATTIAASIAVTDTSIQLATGTGTLFPKLANTNEYFYLTLYTATQYEIVKVTAQIGATNDSLTVVRAQDNTQAQAFVAGTNIELRVEAQALNNFTQIDAQNTYVRTQAATIQTLAYSSTITPDLTIGNDVSITLTGNATLANPSALVPGTSGHIFIFQDSVGSRTLAYGSYYKFVGGVIPGLSVPPNSLDIIPYTVISITEIACGFLGAIQ